MADLEVLLEVQAHDTALDQLNHQRRTLAERATADTAKAEVAASRQDLRRAEAASEAAERRRSELETAVGESDARIAGIESRMFGGEVSAARELESMSAEVASLKERRSALEDEALGAIEAAEQARSERDAAAEAVDGAMERARGADEALAAAEALLDAEIVEQREAREQLAATLPPDLLETYDRIRTKLGGVGAARLEVDRCTGCHLTLPSSELERLRRQPPEAVLLCDNCQRILVR